MVKYIYIYIIHVFDDYDDNNSDISAINIKVIAAAVVNIVV